VRDVLGERHFRQYPVIRQIAVEQWRASWKKLADNPQTKGTLAAACKQAEENSAAAWKTYGCAN